MTEHHKSVFGRFSAATLDHAGVEDQNFELKHELAPNEVLHFAKVRFDAFVAVTDGGNKQVHEHDHNEDSAENEEAKIQSVILFNEVAEVCKEQNSVVVANGFEVVRILVLPGDHVVLEEHEVVHCE